MVFATPGPTVVETDRLNAYGSRPPSRWTVIHLQQFRSFHT